MSKMILVRHGESSGNRDRIYAVSPHDLPLTELGYRQAQQAAQRIAELFQPRLVVTSAYKRASETARIIAGALGLPLEFESNLHEREIGAHRGRSYDSFLTEPDYDPQRPWAWKPQGGESYEEVQARVGPILDRLAAAHPDRRRRCGESRRRDGVPLGVCRGALAGCPRSAQLRHRADRAHLTGIFAAARD